MAKIPFDIKYRSQIECGEYKVETKDGRQVRIISWDKSGFECTEIVALVKCVTGTDNCNIYTIDGLLRSNCYQDNMKLVVITPEPEFTEFEKAVKDLCWNVGMGEVVFSNDIVKEKASKLLKLAYQNLKAELEQDFFEAEQDGIKKGIEVGKADALKDLPRWERATCELFGTASYVRFVNSQHTIAYVESKINKGDWFIRVADLVKLPGFKED